MSAESTDAGTAVSGSRPHLLIVGCGNESRRDDGVGLYVMQALARHWGLSSDEEDLAHMQGEAQTAAGPATLELRFEHQLDLVLADDLGSVDLFVVVDAHTGPHVEALRRVDVGPGYETSMTTHHLTPETLVGLSMALHHRAPRAVVFSVRGYDFNFGSELTPQTQAAADEAITQICDLVSGFRGRDVR